MANKLTKEKLDLLIEQVFNEDFSREELSQVFPKKITGADLSKGRDTGLPSTGSEDVIDNVFAPPPDDKLSEKDIRYFIENPEKIDVKVQSGLIAISRVGGGGSSSKFDQRIKRLENDLNKYRSPDSGPANKLKKKIEFNKENKNELIKLAKLAEEALAALEEKIQQTSLKQQSITDPKFKTVSGASGKFPKDQITVVNRVFAGLNTFEQRMKKLKDISQDFYGAAVGESKSIQAIENKQPSQLLAEIQLIDLFNSMSKEIDSGAGAYVFEYFLAMMMGGNVSGKSKTAKGRMGAVDFELNGKYGSAKYYQNAYMAEQSVSGFIDLYNKNNNRPVEVLYIISSKKQDILQKGKEKAGTSDPTRIMAMEVYMPTVVYDGKNFTIKETGSKIKVSKEGSVLIGRKLEQSLSIGLVYLTMARTESFLEMMEKTISTQKQQVQTAFNSFKQYFTSLEEASVRAKAYINTGDVSDGNKTYDSLRQAEDDFSEISNFLEYEDKPVRPVTENKKINKKSLKDLDKLIERVILYNMNK